MELKELMQWYSAQTDGDWEHSHGVRLTTLDNPGWTLEIDIAETDIEDRPFASMEQHKTESDWMVCRLDKSAAGQKFLGHGGPGNLRDLLRIFLDWAGPPDDEA